MNQYIIAIISFSIIIAGVVGLIRFNKINSDYYPFLFFLWLGLINEIISFYLIKHHSSNAINNNIFYLIESLLIAYQFRNWHLFKKGKNIYYLTLILFFLSWIAENFVFRSIKAFASYFILLHSFIIALMAISMINRLIVKEKRNLLKNPTFIVCVGFIIFFMYAAIVEAFYLYGLNSSNHFLTYVVRIMAFINLFTNLLYALAVLWMPKKHGFSLLY